METNTKRLHPLLTAAAISLTVFSAVGVAALTGLIPHSKGSAKDAAPVAVAAVEVPAVKSEPIPAPQVVAPAPKPAKKHIARAPAAKPAETVAYNEFPQAPVAQAPVAQAPQVIQAPQVVAKPGPHGIVESVREVEQKGDGKGVGAVGGGVAGAVLGHNIGDHNKLVTILGAAGGAFLGNQIEKQARTTKHWELTVRYDDGTTQVFPSQEQPFWHQGDHVRYYEGKLQPV
jgi:outer membrane lipoprotein SlyB